MVLSGARPKGARQATGSGPGSADAKPHDAYRPGWWCRRRPRVAEAVRRPGLRYRSPVVLRRELGVESAVEQEGYSQVRLLLVREKR
jgi:hypothetical protein